MSEIKIQPLDPEAGLVETTRMEAFDFMVRWGRATTLERDGKLYRVLEPWECGPPALTTTEKA